MLPFEAPYQFVLYQSLIWHRSAASKGYPYLQLERVNTFKNLGHDLSWRIWMELREVIPAPLNWQLKESQNPWCGFRNKNRRLAIRVLKSIRIFGPYAVLNSTYIGVS